MAVEIYDDIEQSERVKRWIREYGTAIVLGVILAFGGIYGWRYWQGNKFSQQQQAGELYTLFQEAFEEDDAEQAETRYTDLRTNFTQYAQTALAGLRMAREYVEQDRLDEAHEIYTGILSERRLSALHPIARLRQARVYLGQDEAAQALALIEGEAPVGFESAWAELRGDIEYQRGNPAEARLAYQQALDTLSTGGAGGSQMLELKLNGIDVSENES